MFNQTPKSHSKILKKKQWPYGFDINSQAAQSSSAHFAIPPAEEASFAGHPPKGRRIVDSLSGRVTAPAGSPRASSHYDYVVEATAGILLESRGLLIRAYAFSCRALRECPPDAREIRWTIGRATDPRICTRGPACFREFKHRTRR